MEDYISDLCFGITSEEGIELKLVEIPSTMGSMNKAKDRIKEFTGVKYKERVTILMEVCRLSEYVRVYAEEMAKLNNRASERAIQKAIYNAMVVLNQRSNRETTCLFQEYIKSSRLNHTGPIDLIFPNAKVWIAGNGREYISHDFFRATQSYNFAAISKLGVLPFSNSGDKIVYRSDGIHSTLRNV